jgi:glycosyltransferase involved in cell wall biosynthesis
VNPEQLSYSVVTPARDEVDNLARLAASMIEQTALPSEWVIVDHGSTDGTGTVSKRLAEQHDWIRAVTLDGEPTPTRGGPIVQAFMAGIAEMQTKEQPGTFDGLADVVIKIDADISFPPDHFERLVLEFAREEKLGIASSTCWELEEGVWRPQHVARHHVRGAVRAYRRECLDDVMPLEPRMGWDTIDEVKAQLGGWTTRSVADIPFYHHRGTGERDGRRRSWESQGAVAWYLGYRVSYLVLRTAYRASRDRSAVAILKGWMRAGLRRDPRYPDPEVRRFLRREQSLLRLPLRAREVLGWQRRESTQ